MGCLNQQQSHHDIQTPAIWNGPSWNSRFFSKKSYKAKKFNLYKAKILCNQIMQFDKAMFTALQLQFVNINFVFQISLIEHYFTVNQMTPKSFPQNDNAKNIKFVEFMQLYYVSVIM